jgi:hypothetical protein
MNQLQDGETLSSFSFMVAVEAARTHTNSVITTSAALQIMIL